MFFEVLRLQRHEIDGASAGLLALRNAGCRYASLVLLELRSHMLPAHPVSQHPCPQDDNVRATSTSGVAASMPAG